MPEPGLVIELREEMFNDTRFGAEVFYIHVRGVDTLMVLSYMHILKKIYLKNYVTSESDGWLLGGYAFFWFHYIIALGISLSASHLSDLTLTIIANIF
jgi:quinol-cytochrome oxidoreductase complex cytochrome b subunit